jgi:phosphate:Na+ symporter
MKLSLFHTIFNLIGVIVMTPLIGIMVKKLDTMFVKEVAEGKPKFLTDALMNDATSSLTALRSEINHLYENALEVFAHAINLNRSDIRSNKEMSEIVKSTKDKMAMNIDELYKDKIKGLYDAIIEFSSKAQVNMQESEIKSIFELKIATIDIVEAIKDMKDLEANIDKYSLSNNEYIKKEYNFMRETLGKLLRKVEKIRNNPADATLLTKFVMLKRQIEESDALINGTVDELIRNNKINASMGTSLMNDSAFAYDIGLKIVEAIEILFIRSNKELSMVYNELVKGELNEK